MTLPLLVDARPPVTEATENNALQVIVPFHEAVNSLDGPVTLDLTPVPPAKATENIFVLEVAVLVHKAVISGSLDSHTYTAPVIVTGAHATAAQLSKKLNMLSEKLLQVAQTRACQDYFVDIERFLIIISKQLDEDTGAVAGAGATTTDGVPITVPVVNPFPAMAGKFPTDVPSEKIIWTSWEVCAVDGVGRCHVWHVQNEQFVNCDNITVEQGVFDNIAVAVEGSPHPPLCVNERTILCDANAREVTCLQVGKIPERQRQRIVFVDVCKDFLAWAMSKVARDCTESHFEEFVQKKYVLVECGKEGNCFYHSCIFMLKMFAPDLRINGVDIGTFDHLSLRQATVEHLRNRYLDIKAVSGLEHDNHDESGTISVLTLMSLEFEGNEQEIVSAYCDKYVEKNVVPEEPSVYALAHLLKTTIIVHHISRAQPELAGNGCTAWQLKLWCDDVHYQAVVDSRRIHLSNKARKSTGFKNRNWVHAREVTLYVEEDSEDQVVQDAQ